MGRTHHRIGGSIQGICKKSPRKKTGVNKHRIRVSLGRHLHPPAEDHRKHDHPHERLNKGPGASQHCLFVSNLDVSGGQRPKKIPVGPKRPEVKPPPSPCGSNHRDVLFAEIPVPDLFLNLIPDESGGLSSRGSHRFVSLSASASSASCKRFAPKYQSRVRCKPSTNFTRGSQPSSFFAKELSATRFRGPVGILGQSRISAS